ncbi:UNVERIFIED_CONTAM: putative RNA methyltransferase pc1998 [Sesamum angustifolium]|uniref:RNA methyltransferase pc1998 n=1 Tax=Sesamum angustifolium TaxID=2727405 RepID=A0AAW2RNN1_9LAMI
MPLAITLLSLPPRPRALPSSSTFFNCHATSPSTLIPLSSPSPSPPALFLPQDPKANPISSSSCALHCPHFQSCSGCTHEYNLHHPPILDEAIQFFRTIAVSNFTFDSCRLWGWRCRAKLAVRGSSIKPLIGLYEEGTHNVVDIPECKAHHPSINAAVDLLKQGKVQVALVWNSRNESSPSFEKLNALANRGPKREVHLIHSIWANFQTSTNNVIFGNRWRHLLGERDFWEHVGGIDVSMAPSSFGQANTREPLSWLMGSDVVVVDPPRKGLDSSLLTALQSLSSIKIKHNLRESVEVLAVFKRGSGVNIKRNKSGKKERITCGAFGHP